MMGPWDSLALAIPGISCNPPKFPVSRKHSLLLPAPHHLPGKTIPVWATKQTKNWHKAPFGLMAVTDL